MAAVWREQGITIDVAYRYFAPPKRKFIIADTRSYPIHPQHGYRRINRQSGPGTGGCRKGWLNKPAGTRTSHLF